MEHLEVVEIAKHRDRMLNTSIPLDPKAKSLLNILKFHIGRKNGISNKELATALGTTVRLVTNYFNALRVRGYPVCSESGKGYWWENDRYQYDKRLKRQENTIKRKQEMNQAQRNSMDKYFKN